MSGKSWLKKEISGLQSLSELLKGPREYSIFLTWTEPSALITAAAQKFGDKAVSIPFGG